jgi:hypothetical protein
MAQNEDPGNNEDSTPELYQVNGSSLNIYNNNDSINMVGLNSGSAAMGKNNIVGSFSGAFGMRNTMGSDTERVFVFGADNTVSSSGSFVVGSRISVSGTLPSFVIGEGVGASYPLTPPSGGCLVVGINSTKPTVTVTRSNNSMNTAYKTRTGKVGIGDVTPTAKLHIKSDNGEDAGIILEPKQPTSNSTYIRMRDNNHKISVAPSGLMQITAGSQDLKLIGNNVSVSTVQFDAGTTADRRLVLSTQPEPAFYCNARRSGSSYSRYVSGPSYAFQFGDDGLLVRTAETQNERIDITNWHDALFLGIDSTIVLNGKVGINTENTTTDYALAVAGGVLANKVIIKSTDIWPDYVFDPGYERMPLNELEKYLETHRHLPNVPSAEEMRKRDGVDLAETQTILLRKIEELTLYTLEQQKLIEELKVRSDRQQRQIDALLSGDTVRFTYDACGNRTGRTVEFSRMDEGGGKGAEDPKKPEEWFAELHDVLTGGEASLFPNPTDGVFTLALTGDIAAGAKASLLTLTGEVLSERTVTGTSTEFDLNGHPAGVYLLRLTTDRETRTWKVVKRN